MTNFSQGLAASNITTVDTGLEDIFAGWDNTVYAPGLTLFANSIDYIVN